MGWDRGREPLATSRGGAYAAEATSIARALGSEVNAARYSTPDVVAAAITRASTARRPKTRYTVGYGARPLIGLRRILPDRAFDTLIRRLIS